jgi:hypothetical protein
VRAVEDEVLASIQNVIDALSSTIFTTCDISTGFWDIFKPPDT